VPAVEIRRVGGILTATSVTGRCIRKTARKKHPTASVMK